MYISNSRSLYTNIQAHVTRQLNKHSQIKRYTGLLKTTDFTKRYVKTSSIAKIHLYKNLTNKKKHLK